ncbi:MAG TPA: dihydrofolate reductase family protein [Solirubrobacterales bacterium]|nr:dihydrofolate reductase family protein [Solirubrobacterales bacterium]
MGKVVVTEFISLDGVIEDPGGSEDFKYGGWSFEYDRGQDGNQFKLDELMASEALLLGRITYEGFAAAWPEREDEAGFADKFNSMPKYVVSTTLTDPDWNNSHVISANVPEEVEKVKGTYGGDIQVAGSGTLVQTLLENDLVDQWNLMVFPTILGSGKRLFQDGSDRRNLKLIEDRGVGPDGVTVQIYERAE